MAYDPGIVARFRILSWNIESFGEKKVPAIGDYVARVINAANVDLVVMLETTTFSPTELLHETGTRLTALTPGSEWQGFSSDPTGKAVKLPDEILVSAWPKSKALADFEADLLKAYDRVPSPDRFELKSPGSRTVQGDADAGDALLRAGVLRRDMETYSALFRYDPAIKTASRAYVAVGSYVALHSPGHAQLGLYEKTGKIPIDFAGRSPWVINLFYRDPGNLDKEGIQGNERYFPLVCFHAPFDSDLSVRVRAITNLLNLGMPNTTSLADQPDAVVAGDFNISLNPQDYTDDTSKSHSGKTYGAFYKAGFIPTIKEKSTLTTIRGANRTWTTSAEFRVNAYDNLLLRVHQSSKYRHPAGAVIDLITETFNSSAGNHFLHPVTGQAKFNTIFDAYGWFRTEISDHLPVVCQLDVDGRP